MWNRKACLAMILGMVAALPLAGQLNQSCTVSALNRTTLVQPDGTWVLPNVPANQGPVRVRATCVENGVSRSGQSDFFVVPPRGVIDVADILFGSPEPIPLSLRLTAPATTLTTAGQTVQLTATATFSDGSNVDFTAASMGTSYRSSNPATAMVDDNGLITAQTSGRVLISALNEGALAVLQLQVVTSGDSDGDGLPDDWELANGLDPNNPVDALDDQDGDNLSTIAEYQAGLNPLNADTDGDRLRDGDEAGFGTNPLLFDTDGDRVSDGLEVAAGSDPANRLSVNLAPILADLAIDPANFTIIYNTVLGEGSRRVTVTATLIDGTELDATGTPYGTTYRSSDLTVASFGAEPGRIFAGAAGGASITAENGAFTAIAEVRVEVFAPTALSFLELPGAANAIALEGDFAYVALGGADLAVVDVSDPAAPQLAATAGFPGEGFDVAVSEGFAYVAAGSGGLVVLDVATPTSPTVVGSVSTGSPALGVSVAEGRAYVVNGSALRIFDVSDPSAPTLLATRALPGRPRGLDVAGDLAVIAAEAAGVHVVNVSNPAAPVLLGTTHTRGITSNAADLVVRGHRAYVADGAFNLGGVKVVDLTVPSTPVVVGESTNAFGLSSIALEGAFALGADYFYANAVPIFNVEVNPPAFSAVLNFRGYPSLRDDNGMGVVARDGFVYLVGDRRNTYRFGTSGDSALHIGRYVRLEEINSVPRPPAVSLTFPADGSSVRERRTLMIRANATDDVRVASVRFLVNDQVVATDFEAPYTYNLAVPDGVSELTLTAEAEDLAGNQAVSEPVVVTVIPDTDPAVRLLAPLPGTVARAGRYLPVAAQASDDGSVVRVDFFVGGVLAATRTAPPYRFDLLVPDAGPSLTLTAVARDNVGQTATSEAVVVTVEPNEPPVVAILEPEEGDRVVAGTSVQVVVGATDDVGVVQVSYLVDGEVVATDCCEPFELNVQVDPGATEVRLAARATDGSGHVSTSAEVVLEVEPDQPPVVRILEPQDGDRVLAGDTVNVVVEATDDLGVTEVRCLVDGSVVAIDTDEPFELTFVVPGASEVRLTAEAVDGSGQTTTSEEVLLTVDEAPVTTAIGRVLDDEGHPVAGVLVDCQGNHGLTDASGVFGIPGLSVLAGAVHCAADLITAAGELRRALSVVRAPVAPGVTDLGDLRPDPALLYGTFDLFNTAGALAVIDPGTLMGTLLADASAFGGFAGLAFDSAGRLFATTLEGSFVRRTSRLLELSPDSGAVLADLGPITDGTDLLSVADLAFQPGTDVLYALRSGEDGHGQGGGLYTIDPASGFATRVGTTGIDGAGALAFGPDGSLYVARWNAAVSAPFLRQLDPSDGSTLSEVEIMNPYGDLNSLVARPGDGVLFGGPHRDTSVLMLDPASGLAVMPGTFYPGLLAGLAFRPALPPEDLSTVVGRVIDGTGAPVEGVLVTMRGIFRSVTDGDGRFLFSRVPAGFGEIVVEVPPSWFSDNWAQSALTPLVAGGTADAGDIVLEPADPRTILTGTVVNELGEPVPGAAVKAFNESVVLTTISGSDGSFTITGAPSQDELQFLVTAQAGGSSLRGQAFVSPEPGGVTDAGPIVLFPVEPAEDALTTAAGRVVDTRGLPVAGARVHVFTNWDVFPVTTGADGRFLASGIPTVDVDLHASASVRRAGRLEIGDSDYFLPEPGGITDLGDIVIQEEYGGGGEGAWLRQPLMCPVAPPSMESFIEGR